MANFAELGNINYCGKEAQEIFVRDLYESNLKGYGIRYMSGVKGKTQLMSGEVGDLFQAYSCPFTPSGEVTLSEQWIEPVAIKVNLEECYDAFWNSFLVEQTEISLNGGIPSTFYDWFFNNVLAKKLRKEYEEIFFNGAKGKGGYLGLADGIVKKVNDAENSVKVAGATLTTANILGKIGEVADAINGLDAEVEGYKIFINHMDYRKLMTALGNESPLTTAVWANFAKQGEKVFAYGYEIVPSRIEKNTILASHPMNLVLGYDVENGDIQYKIVDMRESTLENMFRIGVVTNIACGVVYPELCVIAKA
ncbi:hypothetical protein [Methanobrevibacter sp.]|uniref:hypothetical protein n=1 Tax=Methanobrevibacter sp. TaxID=66852 RepID=UPI0038903168